MRKYFDRLWWYVALLLITAGVVMLRIPGEAFFSAIACYLPISLTWIPLNSLMIRYKGFPVKTLGIETERVGYIVMLAGVFIITLRFLFQNTLITSFGILIVFGGIDWVLGSREAKMTSRKNHI